MTRVVLVPVVLLVVVLAAADRGGAGAGTVSVGSTGNLSGPDAGFLGGVAAYLEHLNARGGVRGRSVVLTYLDDQGSPTSAVANARTLRAEGTLALVAVPDPASEVAIRRAGLPEAFAAYRPPDRGVGLVLGRRIAASGPPVGVAVLASGDSQGKALLAGLEAALRAAPVAVETAGDDVQGEIAALAATGAGTLVVLAPAATAGAAVTAAASLSWRPRLYLSEPPPAAPDGAVSVAWAKDPAVASLAGDPGLALARRLTTAPLDRLAVQGMAAAYSLADALRRSGGPPTRLSLRNAARALREASNPFLLPGVTVRGQRPDAVRLLRRQDRRWTLWGGVVAAVP